MERIERSFAPNEVHPHIDGRVSCSFPRRRTSYPIRQYADGIMSADITRRACSLEKAKMSAIRPSLFLSVCPSVCVVPPSFLSYRGDATDEVASERRVLK